MGGGGGLIFLDLGLGSNLVKGFDRSRRVGREDEQTVNTYVSISVYTYIYIFITWYYVWRFNVSSSNIPQKCGRGRFWASVPPCRARSSSLGYVKKQAFALVL